jgi:predicted  nucleic acid-binding Zn-ribbon protein
VTDAGAPLPAETDEQHRLLALQDLDTLADQIAVRRRTVPERRTVDAIEARRSELRASVAARDVTRQTQLAEQGRLEEELAAADARDAELAARLKTIFVPREAEAVMAEQRTLAGRRSELEDGILERMGVVAELDELDAADGKVDEELAVELVAARDALLVAEESLDAELADVAARRAVVAQTLPESVLTRYDRLRRTFDGVAIARLEGGRCLGCHLALSTSELDRIRHAPADAVVECEHCGRLLVR